MSGTRGSGTQGRHLFMWIAMALWLVAALAAVIDGDTGSSEWHHAHISER